MTNVVIASAARTGVGSFGGSFANTPAHDLGAAVLEAVVERAGIDNARFVAGAQTHSDLRAEVAATAGGQFPTAFVLSCVDSRVPVETVFDQGIGDVFVGRVAGNVIDDQMLGSIEFATAVAGTPLIVVMGHTACGAVKGACDSVELGHVTALVKAIEPSVKAVAPEGASSKNIEQVNAVVEHNAKRTADLVPLCHPLPLSHVDVVFEVGQEPPHVRCEVRAETVGREGFVALANALEPSQD